MTINKPGDILIVKRNFTLMGTRFLSGEMFLVLGTTGASRIKLVHETGRIVLMLFSDMDSGYYCEPLTHQNSKDPFWGLGLIE